MRPAFACLSVLLLGGCAGYAADYWKPKQSLIAAQLPRYGIAGGEAQCVETNLTAHLSVWQLRQLADLSGRLATGGRNPSALGPRELLYVAGLARDAEVGPITRRALESCHVETSIAAVPTTMPPPAPAAAPPPSTAAAAPPLAPAVPPAPGGTVESLWLNLGAAKTGQGISVDATSVTRGPSWRQAWFRLINHDQAGVGDIGYLLRVDCGAKSMMALGGRQYAANGTLAEQKDYEKPEGPIAIETGTVIEIAYHALCD